MQHASKRIFRRVKDGLHPTFEFERSSANRAASDGSDGSPATVLSVVKTRASIWNLPSFKEATEGSLPGADAVSDGTTCVWNETVNTTDVLSRISTAAQDADMAVKMDLAGDLSMASRMYKRALVTVVLTIDYLAVRQYNDLAMYDSLHMIADKYQNRVNILERRVLKQLEQRQNRQSRVPFIACDPEADESIERFQEAPIEDSARRPFWQLRLVHRSILFGSFVSPRIYVPRDVWRQHNAKFNALSIKNNVLENLLLHLQHHVLPVSDIARESIEGNDISDRGVGALIVASADAVITALERTVEHLRAAQTEIARSFSYVPSSSSTRLELQSRNSINQLSNSKSTTRESPPPAETSLQKSGGRTLAATFSRVVDSAFTTYKRAEAAVPGRVSTETLAHYAELVSEVCEKSQRFDQWLLALPPIEEDTVPASASPQPARLETESQEGYADVSSREAIRHLLLEVSGLYRDVICEIILRDLENLVERYIKKMRKSFARMYWDEETEED